MSQPTPDPDNGDGADALGALDAYRQRVNEFLLAALPEREPRRHLYDLIRDFVARPGKGLRPALCMATCEAFGGKLEHTLPTAAALELLHNALLVHDDVEDESDYRRNIPTLHRTHGVPLAVNTGDAMNALTLTLLLRNQELVGSSTAWQIIVEFQHLLLESLEGQAMELGWIRDNACDVSEDDYLRMILKKTCWYSFIHPCRLGALLAGASDLDRFNQFGYFTGAAFQIQDDILNLCGESQTYGKEIGGDLWEGKRTLMLSHAASKASPSERARLASILQKPRKRRLAREVAWMQELLTKTGSIDHARAAARELCDAATREFESAYAAAPESRAKIFLRRLVSYMVERRA
jgi:geranylgeranyl diphosphate synthase, type II